MKSVYSFRNYREALTTFYSEMKKKDVGFTYASFSKKSDLASPNYLKLIMDGKRDLTVANIHAFARGLGLEGAEIEYFEALVLENQSESDREKKYYSQKLKKIKATNSILTIHKKPSTLIAEPLKPAVLLCASGKNFDDAVEMCKTELEMDIQQATKSIQELIAQNELAVDNENILRFVSRHELMSDPKGLSDRQRKFLDGGLNEARKIFDERYSSGTAKFLSILMTAPEESLNEIFMQLRSAVEKTTEDFDPDPNENHGVYRLQLQVYRLKKTKSKNA